MVGGCRAGGVRTAAVLVRVMRLDSWAPLSMLPGAWSVRCVDWRSFVLTVGVPGLLCSLAAPGGCGFLRVTPPLFDQGAGCCRVRCTTPLSGFQDSASDYLLWFLPLTLLQMPSFLRSAYLSGNQRYGNSPHVATSWSVLVRTLLIYAIPCITGVSRCDMIVAEVIPGPAAISVTTSMTSAEDVHKYPVAIRVRN